MNITSYSAFLVMIYVAILLSILMDINFERMTKRDRYAFVVSILIVAIVNAVVYFSLGSDRYVNTIVFTEHIPYFLIFMYFTRCGFIKMFFMILTAFVFTAPSIIVSNLVLRSIPGKSFALFASNVATYIICLALAYFVFKKGFNYLIKHADNKFFMIFMVLPFLYYLYVFAGSGEDFSSLGYDFGGYVVRYMPTLLVFVFYFVVLYTYKRIREQNELIMGQAALKLEVESAERQIDHMNEKQTQTAIYQHDMRHHLNAINGYLKSGMVEKAEEYIAEVYSDIDRISERRYCENQLVNMLISSFAPKALQNGAAFDVDVNVPEELPLSDTEITTLLSNSLENALNAVSEVKNAERRIRIYSGIKMNKLILSVENTYEGTVAIKDGLPVSKKAGHGYGTSSIRSIVERHRGMCSFTAENNIFAMKVVIPLG